MAWVPIALSVVSAISSMRGSKKQGEADQQNAQYQAQVARNNQIVAEQNAKYAEQVGRSQEDAKRQQSAQSLGQIRASLGAAGVDPNSGSALRLQTGAAEFGELDALTIRNNAARNAYGYRVQGTDFAAQASLNDSRASNAASSGRLNMFSSLVSGASSFADKWNKFKTPSTSSW